MTAHSEIEVRGKTLRLRGTDLALDPPGRCPFGFVSHAGLAANALPERAIATAATLALVSVRSPRALSGSAPLPVSYGREFKLGLLELALFPAGNVLGAAQLRCDLRGRRIVYAADLGGVGEAAAETAAPREQLEADTLILGARYGDPRYAFPPLQRALRNVTKFVERALAAGATPVLIAAPLGKSQEVARHLGRQGHRVLLHRAAHRFVAVYAAHGVAMPEVAELSGDPAAGAVVIVPPGQLAALKTSRPLRTCLLSGAAVDPAVVARAHVDEALPVSDHADHAQLVKYALESKAKRVLTLGDGAEPLASALRGRGVAAEPVLADRQLKLPGL